jgi:hypothetical protein
MTSLVRSFFRRNTLQVNHKNISGSSHLYSLCLFVLQPRSASIQATIDRESFRQEILQFYPKSVTQI